MTKLQKNIETTAESSLTRCLASRASFFGREAVRRATKVARGPEPYKNRTKDCFESLL